MVAVSANYREAVEVFQSWSCCSSERTQMSNKVRTADWGLGTLATALLDSHVKLLQQLGSISHYVFSLGDKGCNARGIGDGVRYWLH